MRRLFCAALGIALMVGTANAASDDNNKPENTGGTAKGAAAGALAGHEMGSGHAKSGAVVGAMVGHHDKKKAEENQQQK